jgi:hypothetical protein
MVKLYRLLLPFAIIGVVLITVGFIINNEPLIYFGIVWLIVSVVAYLGNMARRP